MSGHWDRFWTGHGTAGGGCLPGGGPVERAQRQTWHEFARSLPRGARVLDLGTGDGRVMGWLLERRRDLKPTGIDSARQLPKPPRGAKSMVGVAMEDVPLPSESFDAVSSQFGIEYGDVEAAVRELVRLLRPKGRFRLMIHHSAGPIVTHNLARAEGLEWACRSSGAMEKARGLASARAIANVPTPAYFRELVAEARARFGVGSGAEELSLALLQTLEGSRGTPPQEALAAVRELEELAKDELARIAAMAAAAADKDKIGRIAALLGDCGASVEPERELADAPGAPPFAWLVDGTKA
jgi:SAM-dependent methyltransferase